MSENFSTPPMTALERQEARESKEMSGGLTAAEDSVKRLSGQRRVAIRHVRRALGHLSLCEPNEVRAELRAALVYLGDEEYLRRTKYRTCDKCHGLGVVMTGEGNAECSCGIGEP